MGYQIDTGYVLVIMTNKDVYYLDNKDTDKLQDSIEKKEFYKFFDAKSGALIRLNTKFISSIVKEFKYA